jgi:hypothetical protein
MQERQVEPPRPPTPGTKAALALELATLRADLRVIVESIKCEAQKRAWCSDYEYWVRHTNPRLSKPWLLVRQFSDTDYRCDICGRVHYA